MLTNGRFLAHWWRRLYWWTQKLKSISSHRSDAIQWSLKMHFTMWHIHCKRLWGRVTGDPFIHFTRICSDIGSLDVRIILDCAFIWSYMLSSLTYFIWWKVPCSNFSDFLFHGIFYGLSILVFYSVESSMLPSLRFFTPWKVGCSCRLDFHLRGNFYAPIS